jgi:hypothetical protein
MKTLGSGLLILALMAVGCGKESEPGGPGASTKPGGTVAPGTTANGGSKALENTFTIKVPATETSIDQGENKDITVAVDRGDQFKQKVALAFAGPEGVTVTPASGDVTADLKDMKVNVAVAPGTALGHHELKVTATPETGKAVTEVIKIEVKEGSGAAAPPKP